MNSLSSTDGWYDGRPVASASIPLNLRSARSSSSTNTSITRTGLSSQIQSSRHSGNSVLWWRSVPSTKRFIRFLRKLRRNHNPRITSLSVFLHNQDPERTSDWPMLTHKTKGGRLLEGSIEHDRYLLNVDAFLDHPEVPIGDGADDAAEGIQDSPADCCTDQSYDWAEP